MAATNLHDAAVEQLSPQGRYEFAYNAGRLIATIAVRASGYRVIARNGHHFYTFQALQAVDRAFIKFARHFDRGRDKRNQFSYDAPLAISETDAKDLVDAANKFLVDLERWVTTNHPSLAT